MAIYSRQECGYPSKWIQPKYPSKGEWIKYFIARKKPQDQGGLTCCRTANEDLFAVSASPEMEF